MSNVCGGQGCVCSKDRYREPEAKIVARDPVCGKKLDCNSEGVRQLNWEGAVFYFCDTRCMTKFVQNPKKYVGKKGIWNFLKFW
ncbi:YHS domain-containing protein [Pseudodesulfovibrio sp. zrk46]|uniref:YHS domain-containing protein n=1 Tax=Pseudodesulfovibrio sp. zrk46 TaxID=2725288 RepID=UPI001448D000|nr:YHS domain-containing protein [Pseudodesulfovibrio sp. zrk46]QJB55508.1 YHS domain-containing protein [Pseudodesulfovibrio sp. zrk46]